MYLICNTLFVTCLLLSNIAAFKMIAVGPLTLTAAVILFPITYIINDLLAEVYGYKKAKSTIVMGFAMNILMVTFFMVTIALKAPVWFEYSEEYALVLGNTPRLLCASLIAYLCGNTLNAKVLCKMKESGGKSLFARCVLSTLVGEFVDSIIFVTIGFMGTMPNDAMLTMIVTQASFKTVYEIIIFPVTQEIIKYVKRVEGIQ